MPLTPNAGVKYLQIRLNQNGFGPLKIDGLWGVSTRAALDKAIPPAPEKPLLWPEFFAYVRTHLFGGRLTQAQVDGLNRLYVAMLGWPVNWKAYGFATAFHETDKRMEPIDEYGKGRGKPYGASTRYGGQVAYGRGYVQLTWEYNYEKADAALGLGGKLLANFDLAKDPEVAALILRHGMEDGWFTGKSLGDYEEYGDMRRVINGTDRADFIAGYARHFEAALLT